MKKVSRIFVIMIALMTVLSAVGVASANGNGNGAGGVTGPAFYVDGQLYRTVLTPTDFSNTNAPVDSFDIIYDFGGLQMYNVADSAPGMTDYNGGRWMVRSLSFGDYSAALAAHDYNSSGDFDSLAEVMGALGDGSATDNGVVKSFECPVIKLR